MVVLSIDSVRLGENEWSSLILLGCCRPIYFDTDQNIWRKKKKKKSKKALQWNPDPTVILGHYVIIISMTCIYLSLNDSMYLTAGWRRGTRSPFPLCLSVLLDTSGEEVLLSTGRFH